MPDLRKSGAGTLERRPARRVAGAQISTNPQMFECRPARYPQKGQLFKTDMPNFQEGHNFANCGRLCLAALPKWVSVVQWVPGCMGHFPSKGGSKAARRFEGWDGRPNRVREMHRAVLNRGAGQLQQVLLRRAESTRPVGRCLPLRRRWFQQEQKEKTSILINP